MLFKLVEGSCTEVGIVFWLTSCDLASSLPPAALVAVNKVAVSKFEHLCSLEVWAGERKREMKMNLENLHTL